MKKVPGGNELLNAERLLQDVGLGPRQIVADLGCGSAGYFVLQAARLVGEKGLVYAVDILKSALQSVESRAKVQGFTNIQTIWSDLEVYRATQIPDKTLDHALLINTLFQSKKHEEIVRESHRMLKSGGKLTVVDWGHTKTPFGPSMGDRVPAPNIRAMMERLGMRDIEPITAGPFHFGLTAIKV